MKRTFLLIPALALLIGCTSFSTSVFRAEKLAADTGVASVRAVNAYVRATTNNPSLLTMQQNVWDASRKLSASLAVLEMLRTGYETNAATKPQVQAALDAVSVQSSNLVWLATYLKGK